MVECRPQPLALLLLLSPVRARDRAVLAVPWLRRPYCRLQVLQLVLPRALQWQDCHGAFEVEAVALVVDEVKAAVFVQARAQAQARACARSCAMAMVALALGLQQRSEKSGI